MSEETKELQSIDWRRCFAFLEILRSFRMAIHPASLLLCFLGLAATFWLAVLVDQCPGVGQKPVYGATFYQHMHRIATTTLWGKWAFPYVDGKTWDDFWIFLLSPAMAAREVKDLVVAYWERSTWFALVNTILGLAVWAVVGGAVTRMAAVRFAREESVPLKQAVGFSLHKWPSAAASPLIPFGVLVLAGIVVGVLTGLPLMVLPYVGEMLVGVLFFLALLMGLVMAFIFVGGLFSVGLQWPTIAAEGSDSFDAISRSVSYISSRPWRYLFYTLFSVVYGCLTFILVKFVTFLTLRLTHEAVSTFTWGSGSAQDKLSRLWDVPTLANPWPESGFQLYGWEGIATYVFAFWVWVVLGMMMAFLVSFFFTSQTVIYFLLRKTVDATDFEEVYMEESEEEELPVEQTGPKPEVVKISGTPPAAAKPAEPPPT